jgi:hypothetical protein
MLLARLQAPRAHGWVRNLPQSIGDLPEGSYPVGKRIAGCNESRRTAVR